MNLKTSASVAAASAVAAPAFAKTLGANDRLRVGIVGLGGRGKSHIAAIHEARKDNVELAAMCDCDATAMVQNCCFGWNDRNILVEFAVRNWYTNAEAGFRDKYPFVQEKFPVGTIFLGTKGYLIIPDYSSYYTFLGTNRGDYEPGPFAKEEGHPISNQPHFDNWIQAIRSRNPKDLHAEIANAHYSSTLCHLANIAYRTGHTLEFDAKTERFVGNDEANAMLSRDPRSPYVVPEVV